MPTNDDAPSAEDGAGNVFGDLLTNLVGLFDSEDDAALAAVIGTPSVDEAERALTRRDPDAFRRALRWPCDRIVDAALRRAFPDSPEARFLFSEYRFVHRHLRNLFEIHEGPACCADKAGAVIRALLDFHLDGRRIEFDRNAEYTYAFPVRILTGHDEIVDFAAALRRLHYGYPDDYVAAIARLGSGTPP